MLGKKIWAGVRLIALGAALMLAVQPGQAQQQPDYSRMGDLQREIQARANERDYDAAVELGKELLQLTGAAFGRRSADYGFLASQIARLAQAGGDYQTALEFHRIALSTDPLAMGNELRREILWEASLLISQFGQASEAIPLIEEGLQLLDRTQNPDPVERASWLGNLGANLSSLGRYREAFEINEQVIVIFEALAGPYAPETMRALHNRGTLLGRQGLADQELVALLEVVERRTLALGRSNLDTINSLDSLARHYSNKGEIDLAEELFLEIIAAREAQLGTGHVSTMINYEYLAMIAVKRGDLAKAIEFYDLVIATASRVFGPSHGETVRPRGARADLYADVGEVDRAISEYRAIIELLEADGLGSSVNASAIVFNLANVLTDNGRSDEALALYERAFTSVRDVRGQGSSAIFISSLKYAGALLSTEGRAGEALVPAQDALGYVLERRDALFVGNLDSGQLAQETSDFSRAGRSFLDALWSARAGEIDGEEQDKMLDALQLNLETPANDATKRAVLRVAARRGGGDLEARIAEREQLEQQRAANQEALRDALSSSEPDTELIDQLNETRRDIARSIDRVDSQLSSDFPEYFAILAPSLADASDVQAALKPNEAMIALVPTEYGTHVVALMREGVSWHRSELSRDEIDLVVRRLLYFVGGAVEPSFEEEEEWLDAVDGGFNGFDRDSAFALYQSLFAPIEGALEGKSEWILAPSGSLATLPFSLLVTEAPQGLDDDPGDLRATSWLIDKAALSQSTSLQSFVQSRTVASKADTETSGKLFGFGDPILTDRGFRRGGRGRTRGDAGAQIGIFREGAVLADPELLRDLSSLPGTAQELENLESAFGEQRAAIFLRAEATETAFKRTDMSSAEVIVIATHGLLADEVAGLSEPGLVFTPPSTASAMDDGYLSASEVLELNLGAEWVILSACNTAAPDGNGATALSGLARSFFFSGASSLLVSHWLVRDDVAPAITMDVVGPEGEKAPSKAEALRRAMIAVRSDTSKDDESFNLLSSTFAHPSAWAPFVVVGGH